LYQGENTVISHFITLFTQAFFPITCLGCGEADTWLCRSCQNKITIRDASQTERVRYRDYLDKVYIVGHYSQSTLSRTIEEFKYHYRDSLHEPLGDIMCAYLKKNKLVSVFETYLVVPLPLHPRRKLERGFNQSELLAQYICREFGLTLNITSLKRVLYTKHQTTLNKQKRAINMYKAFSVPQTCDLAMKNILLIDDVVTTGASLNEAARTLRCAGAKKVSALVLAKN